jgi:hypothetical protein
MIGIQEIEKKAQRLWPLVMRSALTEEEVFPWVVSLGTPRGQDLSDYFAPLTQWLKEIRDFAQRSGLSFREARINHRSLGEQTLPTHIVCEDRELYLQWMGRKSLFTNWLGEARSTIEEFPQLNAWTLQNVTLLEKHLQDWSAVRSCLRRFIRGDFQQLYLRELDITAVDSKFVEKHRMLLAELLSLILPSEGFDTSIHPGNVARFCQKFGLRYDQRLIRFRCLDDALLQETGGFRDLSVPLSEFSRWSTQAGTIFIVENKINGLSFPLCKGSIIIFGLGGGIDMLREVPWLQSKRLIYWGDIDSHGFAILARLRRYFPAVQSFLMDRETFLLARSLWVHEERPYTDALDLSCLNQEEQEMLASLKVNEYGENLRLEQERVPFAHLCVRLRALLVQDQ